MSAVTTHWNQVTNKGAGMDTEALDIKALFKYTIDIDTNQYVATTDAIYVCSGVMSGTAAATMINARLWIRLI